MKNLFLVIFWGALSVVPAFCGQPSDVALDDGSVIRAEVVSLQDGKYTLRSQSLGMIQLEASRVESISKPGVPAEPGQDGTPLAPESLKERAQDAQAQMVNDPEAMAMVAALAADPEFKELTSDPEAMAALQSGDSAKLKNNARFNALMDNPRMQAIAARLANTQK